MVRRPRRASRRGRSRRSTCTLGRSIHRSIGAGTPAQVRADSHDNRPGGIPFPCHETRPALLGSPTGGEQALPFRDEPARSPQSPPESVVPEARAPELRGSAGTASGGHIQEPRQERNRDGDQSEPWGHPLGGGDSRREGLSLARRRRLLLRLDDLLRAP